MMLQSDGAGLTKIGMDGSLSAWTSDSNTGNDLGFNTVAGQNGHLGSIGEILIYDTVLTGTDLTDAVTYLNDKWAAY